MSLMTIWLDAEIYLVNCLSADEPEQTRSKRRWFELVDKSSFIRDDIIAPISCQHANYLHTDIYRV